jgi:hypothetical protein
MYWPLNHQIAPADQSLACIDCHSRENSRIASLGDFYLPGRDYHAGVEILGILLIISSIIGVIVHATCRVISGRKCKMNQHLNN